MGVCNQQAVDFLRELQSLYFEQRDLNGILSRLDRNITWIGIGKKEVCRTYAEAETFLREEAHRFHHSFQVVNSWYEESFTDTESCAVYGEVTLKELDETVERQPFLLRISAVCRISENGITLCHIHLSTPSADQFDGEFFPSVFPRNTAHRLRRMLEEQSAKLKEKNSSLQALTDNIPGGVFHCLNDERLTLLQLSDGFLKMFGYNREEVRQLYHDSFLEMIYQEDRQSALTCAALQMVQGKTKELEYRVAHKDGSLRWVMDKGQMVQDELGRDSFYCILIDITKQKSAQEELHMSLERHKIIMNQTTDIIFEWDMESDLLLFSSNWKKKFGYEPLKCSRQISVKSHIHPEDISAFLRLMESARQGKAYSEAEFRIQNAQNVYIWCRIRATGQFNKAGRAVKAVGVIVDIDAEKKMAQALMEKAEKDTLTGLYNKMTAQTLVADFIRQSGLGQQGALFILDIDNFKLVNDSKGHMFGDAVLTHIAEELKKQVRSSDIVGRIGGDEFLVFFKNIPNEEFCKKRAEQIIAMFQTLFADEKKAYHVSCSIGVSIFPRDGKGFQQLYQMADIALYNAKYNGKNCCEVYHEALNESWKLRAEQVERSNTAIESEQGEKKLGDSLISYVFRMLYQSRDMETAVNMMLEVIGKQFDVSRAYIFENAEDDHYCGNTFEWCNEGVKPEIENLRKISYEELGGNYTANFNEDGIFYCRDISTLPKKQYRILELQGIKSMLQCAITDKGVFKGYVGFDECDTLRLWTQEQIDSLTILAEILSTFLLKQRAQERLEKRAEHMCSVLDH